MLFLERFGKKVAIWFTVAATTGTIISIIQGYMHHIVAVLWIIAMMGCWMWDIANTIREEQQKAFKEMMDKAFKIDEVKNNADTKNVD